MGEEWGLSEWLAIVLLVAWALRLSYKFGRETGKDEVVEQFRRDPERTLRDIEVERARESRFRRWARGRDA